MSPPTPRQVHALCYIIDSLYNICCVSKHDNNAPKLFISPSCQLLKCNSCWYVVFISSVVAYYIRGIRQISLLQRGDSLSPIHHIFRVQLHCRPTSYGCLRCIWSQIDTPTVTIAITSTFPSWLEWEDGRCGVMVAVVLCDSFCFGQTQYTTIPCWMLCIFFCIDPFWHTFQHYSSLNTQTVSSHVASPSIATPTPSPQLFHLRRRQRLGDHINA